MTTLTTKIGVDALLGRSWAYDDVLALVGKLQADQSATGLELARLKAENARLRKSRHNAQLRGDLRQVERAAVDAQFLLILHLTGLDTSRRSTENHGLTQWHWERAVGILRLGLVHNRRGWSSTDPQALQAGLQRGRAAALTNPERWKMRLNRRHLNV